MESWDELDALLDELRAANEQWRTSAEKLAEQLAPVRTVSEKLDEYFAELAVLESLLAINQRVFNESGRLHMARSDYGLTRVAALIWHTVEDPRPDLASAPPEGMYSVEVRVGPRYLLGVTGGGAPGSDERLHVLIQGDKQLLAPLPTSREKFRTALLRAFAAPGYSGPPREPRAQPAADEQPAAPEQPEAGTGPAEEPLAPAAASGGAQTQTEAAASAASGSTNGAAQTAEAPQPEQPAQPEEPPEVIELPGSNPESQP